MVLNQIAAVSAVVLGLCSQALVSSAFPKAWKNTLTKNQTWWVMKAKIVYPDHINRKMIFTQQLFYQQIKAPVLVLGTGVCCNFWWAPALCSAPGP